MVHLLHRAPEGEATVDLEYRANAMASKVEYYAQGISTGVIYADRTGATRTQKAPAAKPKPWPA